MTSDIALSMNTPVGSPRPSRMISPPGGFGVSRVTPASSIAFLFASPACPSTRLSHTGRSGTAFDSDSCVGSSLLDHDS